MRYVDYDWELTDSQIIPDKELDTSKLGWKIGDYWRVVEIDGIKMLKKVDPLIQFVLGNNNEYS